jgi:glutamate dehydrogenase/leucine dehydrogenase
MPELLRDVDEIGPERIYHVYDPESGMRAVVVIDTTVFGRAAGGTRMMPDITTEEIIWLARAMTYKYSMFDFPTGGAKGGIWADPTVHGEKRDAILRAFGRAVRPLFEAGVVGLGSDMGTDARDTAIFREAAGFPSRGLSLSQQERDGEPVENHATGYGVVVAARAACEFAGISLKEARVAIEGFGKAGGGVARYMVEEGARIVAISNIQGAVYNKGGLDVEKLLEERRKSGDRALQEYESGQQMERGALYFLPVDVLVPGARPYVIDGKNASRVQARVIASIANIPITDEGEEVLFRRGIHSVPDFISNVGGVVLGVTSAIGGTCDDVFKSLREIVGQETRGILADASREGINPRALAVRRIKEKVLRARKEKKAVLSDEERLNRYRQCLRI